jgi:outer membrane protein OmpA-like peptidoglycan-associated protein
MSVNLLEILKQIFGSNFAALASRFLGESESNTQSAVTAMIPALLGAVMQKGSTMEGARSLLDTINSPQVDTGVMGNMSQLLGGGDANRLLNTGSGLLNSLLGSNSGTLSNVLASMSGMSGSSTSKLLGLAAPFLFGAFKKLVGEHGLNAGSLMSLLGDQKRVVQGAIDPRIAQAMNFRMPDVAGATREVAADTASGIGKIIPWIIGLIVAALLLFWLMRGCKTNVAENTATATSNTPQITAEAAATRSIQLPDGTSINVRTGGFIDSLVTFLNSNATPGQPFALDAVEFETNSATLTSTSNDQLSKFAAVLKAYPSVAISVDGHTDNTGDSAANKKLSEDRAAAVKDVIVGMGVPGDRVTTAGWGAEKPIASNDTEEGKLKNRRVEIAITKR